jgi:hypothetical protein
VGSVSGQPHVRNLDRWTSLIRSESGAGITTATRRNTLGSSRSPRCHLDFGRHRLDQGRFEEPFSDARRIASAASVGDIGEHGSHERPAAADRDGRLDDDDDDPKPAGLQLVRRILREGPDGNPGTFAYSDIGTHLLSAGLAQATGMTTLAYARRELFDPLGIDSQPPFEGPIADVDKPEVVSANSFRWLHDPEGVHAGPFGLALTARDMVRIGELWLNGGV